MSLVAYDQSDDSDEEEILSSQPKISTNISVSAVKRRKEAVKISIPSLKEFEDEECPVVSKKPKVQSTYGLFSLLPPPKNTSTLNKPGFVPYVLSSKKANAQPAPSKFETKVTKNKVPKVTSNVLEDQNSDEEESHISNSSDNSHDIPSRDFFSLDSGKIDSKLNSKDYLEQDLLTDRSLTSVQSDSLVQKSSLSEPSSSNSYSEVQQDSLNYSGAISYAEQDSLPINYGSSTGQEYTTEPDSFACYTSEPVLDSNLKESLLKDKEFLKLQGRRRGFETADIIDVNADDQLTDKNEWLMKSLTEETTHRPSRKKCNMPTQQQKRKHQITYLAFQAKEREMDLKNQWAMNSRTRRETQAKYGF